MSEFSFQTLGSIDLRDGGGGTCDAVLVQPKRVAFLAYMAIEAHGCFTRRDALTALFWPSLEDARARQNLRQTLHELRRELRSDLFLTRGNEEVGLSRDVLECDANRFVSAIGSERVEEALGLYGGEFLPSFHLSGAREFSDWLDRTRDRLHREAVGAATGLIRLARAEGDVQRALAATHRARQLAQYDEVFVRIHVQLLADDGRRAEALLEYDRFAERLSRELGIDPAPKTRALVHALSGPEARDAEVEGSGHRSGSRRAPRVAGLESEGVAVAGESAPRESGSARPHGSPPSLEVRAAVERRRTWRAVAVGVVFTVGALAMLSLAPNASSDMASPLDPRLIVAFPFDTRAATADLEPWGPGVVHLLYHALAESPGTRLTYPPTSFALWEGSGGAASVSQDSVAMRVARRLGAARLLRGSLVGSGERLRLQAEVIRVPDGTLLASSGIEGSLDDMASLVHQLAVKILAVGEGFGSDDALADVPLEALEHYVAGLQAFRDQEWVDAAEHHRDALALDSSFAAPALQMLLAAQRTTRGPPWLREEPWRVAWALKDRMSEADRAHVIAIEGPTGPDWGVTAVELIRAAEEAARVAPDRPQIYETLARWLLYYGQAVGIEDWADRAAEAADRALQLTDRPSYNLAGIRTVVLRHESAPPAEKAERARALLAEFGRPDRPFFPFMAYVATRDTAYWLRFEREGLPHLRLLDLQGMSHYITHEGLSTTAWRDAVDAFEERALLPTEEFPLLYFRFLLEATEGRPGEAAPRLRTLVESGYEEFGGVWWFLRTPIHRALIEPGWEEAVSWATSRIADLPDSLMHDPSPEASRSCHLGLAALVLGDLAAARAELGRTRARADRALLCPLLLDALIEHRGTDGGSGHSEPAASVPKALEALDRAMGDFPLMPEAWITNAVLARLWWERGDVERALGAARRRGQAGGWFWGGGEPAQMLIEARALAALDAREAAIQAYEGYLRLRREPDARMLARVDSARNELAILRR